MKYLNLGCGSNFSTKEEWVNIDFIEKKPYVLGHNLLNGIPFKDNSFDFIYHSHVLEHFSKKDGEAFLKECFRVLKPGGVLRIAIPDLEQIAKKYLYFLDEGLKNPNNREIRLNYEWMKIEMYDQTVRNFSGGEMLNFLSQKEILNEEFIYERIGDEGRKIREFLKSLNSNENSERIFSFKERIKNKIKKILLKKLNIDEDIYIIGKFRMGGEIHQWMYDRYSLSYLLEKLGGEFLNVKTAFESNIDKWNEYELDGKYPNVKKPDSIFIECTKK